MGSYKQKVAGGLLVLLMTVVGWLGALARLKSVDSLSQWYVRLLAYDPAQVRDLREQELAVLQQKMAAGEADSAVYVRAAYLWESLGEYHKAAQTMRQAMLLAIPEGKGDEELYRLTSEYARLLAAAGRQGEALRILAELKKQRPDRATAFNQSGKIHAAKRRLKEARAEFIQGKKADSRDIESYRNLSELERRAKKEDQALRHLKEALEKNPDSAAAHAAMGDFYFRRGDYARAMQYYSRASQLEPGNPEYLAKMARTAGRQGDPAKAVSLWQRVLQADKDNVEAHTALARDAAKRGEAEKALGHYRAALERDSKNQKLRDEYDAYYRSQKKITEEKLAKRQKRFSEEPAGGEESSDLDTLPTGIGRQAETDFLTAEPVGRNRPGLHANDSLADGMTKHSKANSKSAGQDETNDSASDNARRVAAAAQAGRTAFENKDYALALEHFREAARLDPQDAQYSYFQARAYEKLGNHTEAERLYEEALRKAPRDARLQYQAGRYFYQRQQFARAEKAFAEAAVHDPGMGAAHYGAALAAEKQGRDTVAEEGYRKALSINPQMPEARFNLALLLKKKNNHAEALAELEALSKITPTDPQVAFQRGEILQRTGKTSEAIEAYEKAIAAKNDFYEARFNLALLLSKTGNHSKARQIIQPVLDKNPDDAEALYTLGRIEQAEGKNDRAVQLYARATEKNPRLTQAWLNGGVLLAQQEDYAMAELYLRKAKSLESNSFAVMLNLANLHLRQKKYQDAEKEFFDLLKQYPTSVEARTGYARSLEENGQFEKAAIEYRKVLKAEPKNVGVLERLAFLTYRHLKDNEAAARLFRRLLELQPDNSRREEIKAILAAL